MFVILVFGRQKKPGLINRLGARARDGADQFFIHHSAGFRRQFGGLRNSLDGLVLQMGQGDHHGFLVRPLTGLADQGDADLLLGLPPFRVPVRIGGGVRRLGVRFCDSAGSANWSGGLGAAGGWAAGDIQRFQGWYRDASGPCGSTFNLTQGIELTFQS